MPIYQKSTKELFEEFAQSLVPPPSKGFGLYERKLLVEGGSFKRKEILKWFRKGGSDLCLPHLRLVIRALRVGELIMIAKHSN